MQLLIATSPQTTAAVLVHHHRSPCSPQVPRSNGHRCLLCRRCRNSSTAGGTLAKPSSLSCFCPEFVKWRRREMMLTWSCWQVKTAKESQCLDRSTKSTEENWASKPKNPWSNCYLHPEPNLNLISAPATSNLQVRFYSWVCHLRLPDSVHFHGHISNIFPTLVYLLYFPYFN